MKTGDVESEEWSYSIDFYFHKQLCTEVRMYKYICITWITMEAHEIRDYCSKKG